MRKLLLTSTVVLAAVVTAAAADLPARYPVKAPPVVAPAFNWSGFYVGGFVGGAWHDRDVTVYDRNGFAGPLPYDTWSYNPDSSFIGGGTIGWNWQPVGSPFVFGIEGEIGYLSLSGSAYDPLLITPALSATTKIGDWYGLIAGRLGYSWDRALVYVKGGVAFVDVETSIWAPTVGLAASASDTKTAWAVGGGIEWAFDLNWSIKAEYLYLGLDDTQTVTGIVAGTPYAFDYDLNGIHTAKVGINYRFGAAAPLVAKY
ncbi:outer membrane protein [Rhodoplanes roseus]|uniref:Outer membrane protein beta-barrel domain-containing protein n=1 Tax=Rhodoplanes roseus TaxID=29409 RepID=A0A327L1Q2_9BRAD|nr:outer membrane beta-barrel protein [Rhodoplanes roseus]RAI43905.1 hypothetical protein CH341_11825 [Rhodoplanes roseus]